MELKKGQDAAENQDSRAYGTAQAFGHQERPAPKEAGGRARVQGLQPERRPLA